MTSKHRRTTTTALATAIAAALVAAPVAWSASRAPAAGKLASKPAIPQGSKFVPAYGSRIKAPAQEEFDSFIISFHKGTKPNAAALSRELDRVGRVIGTRIGLDAVTGTGAQVIRTDRKLDSVDHKQLVIELSQHPSVRAVEPNGRLYRALEPNDPFYGLQWHYHDAPMGINVEGAWDSYDGDGIVVAVVDTGQVNHGDLPTFIAGYDMISDPANARDGDGRDGDPNDEGDWDDKYDSSWHGTHVAGTIAAVTDNGLGVSGVAHGASVQHVRVLGAEGGTFQDVADGIIWAAGGAVPGAPANPTPADVINVSLGGGGPCSTLMQDAIDIAVDEGAIVVVAAGNSSGDVANFTPANCDGIITVAGTGPDNTRYASTNFGEEIEVAAPAGSGVQPAEDQVLSTLNSGAEGQVPSPAGDIYAWYAGTSMAAPHVVGTVALMLEAAGGPGTLTLEEATEILVNTGYATNELVANCDTTARWCASLIDASYAVAVAAGDEDLPPEPPGPPPPPPPTVLENGVTVELPAMPAGNELFFVLTVPEDSGSVVFNMSPLPSATGDSDLYVKFGAPPTGADWDCRPFTGGTVAENCVFANPEAGDWYVRIHAWNASTGYTLTGTYDEEPPPPPPPPTQLENGVPIGGLSVGAGEEIFFVLDVPDDATNVTFQMAGGTGDADLYTLFGEPPTDANWACRPFVGGNNETCSHDDPEAGTWYVRIKGFSAASNFSITGTHDGDTGPEPGAPTNLAARFAYPLRGGRIRVPLTWTGGDGEQVDVVFNGSVVGTADNTGRYVHTFSTTPGPGTATYQVCNAGTSECSAQISVSYTAW